MIGTAGPRHRKVMRIGPACHDIEYSKAPARSEYPCHFPEKTELVFEVHADMHHRDEVDAPVVNRQVVNAAFAIFRDIG